LAIPTSIPEKGAIVIAAFAVVAFSVFAQGLTMPWMIGVLSLTRKTEPPTEAIEEPAGK
jgi:CPA1 family monovalent cation:H+ antiporter